MPSRLNERQFLGITTDLTPDGRPSKSDCIVCCKYKVKRHHMTFRKQVRARGQQQTQEVELPEAIDS